MIEKGMRVVLTDTPYPWTGTAVKNPRNGKVWVEFDRNEEGTRTLVPVEWLAVKGDK